MAYVYAIGDNLMAWTSYLCLENGESDYYRLNEIVNMLDLWDNQFIFQNTFINLLKLYVLPSYQLAKDRFLANQCLHGYSANPYLVQHGAYEKDEGVK